MQLVVRPSFVLFILSMGFSIYSFTRHLLSALSFVIVVVLLSCGGSKDDTAVSAVVSESSPNSSPNDSVLRVAVLPVRECDVLRYALNSGMAARMGLKMELVEYDALMDVDTAVLSGMAHIYFEDSLRVCRIVEDSVRPHLLLSVPVRLSLVANKDKEIKTVRDLKANMVGLTRWSLLERWMTTISSSAALEQMDVYHAQINSIPLRFRMLNDGLIDAGILPQPWADSLLSHGHILMEDTLLEGMGFFVAPSVQKDSIHQMQTDLLKKVYLEALKTQYEVKP